MELYTKNINALKEKNPNLYNKLKNMKEYTHYEVFQSDDPANINYINTDVYKPVYENPIKDTMGKIKEFEQYNNYPILYFFGLGNGIFYKMLFANEKLEKVIIFEPDIEIIYLTFSLIDLSEELLSDKLELVLTQDYSSPQAGAIFEDWQFKFFLKTYNLHILTPFYASAFQKEVLKVNELNIDAIKHLVIAHGNDATDSLIGIRHGYHHIPQMVENYKVSDLIKQKVSNTAVLVSTGPSLIKQLPLLKKVAPYVTIISVDASLPILEKAGIKPDIVCILERVALTSKFMLNTSDEFMKDIHFVVASLAHSETIDAIKGKKVLTMRPFQYNRYLKLDEFGYFGVGMSAANMALEIAFRMKHSTTIFIGQDLAYGDGVSHAKGHVLGEDEIVKRKTNDFYVTAYGGKGTIKTYKFWDIFRHTFETAIHEINGTMKVVNSTEGGARIHGSLEIPFIEAVKNLHQQKKPIQLKKVKKKDSLKYLNKAIKRIDKAIIYGTKKQKKFEKLFLKVAKAWDDLVFLNKTNQLEKIDFKTLMKLANEIDDLKETFNEKRFQALFFDILQPFIIHEELELATVTVKPVNSDIEKQAKIIDWVMKHKGWLFTAAGSIDTQLHVMREELKYLKVEYAKKANQ